jgi:hypothetical protein
MSHPIGKNPFGKLGIGGINSFHFKPAALHIPSFRLVCMEVHTEHATSFKVEKLGAVLVVGGPDKF